MPVKVSGRKLHLDMLRILASFLVCFNHSQGFHAFLEQKADGSLLSWVHVVLSVITAFDIPIFFMLSGAVLLEKEESFRVLFSKRIWRFCVLLFSASAVVYIVNNAGGGYCLTDFLRLLLSGDINLSYWYLFAHLSLLLMLPFLRKIARQITLADILLLMALRALFGAGIPILNFWLRHWNISPVVLSGSLQAPLSTLDFLYFPLLGHYLTNRLPMEKVGRREIAWCAVILLAGVAASAWMTYMEGLYEAFTRNYLGAFQFSSAAMLFIIVRYVTERVTIPAKAAALISRISSVTLGIYLFEPIVSHFLYMPFFDLIDWHPVLSTPFSFLWCLLCMVLGGSATCLLRKIPGVSKFL